MSADFWIILTAILAAVACGLIGCFLVLRQNAMLGDAISHAVLPGLVVAFLVTSSRNVVPMIIGAGAMGILTAYLSEVLSRTGRLYRDAALGIVFTVLFATGVILVSVFAGQVDLDQECVLYGEIAYTPWDRFLVYGSDFGPRAVWILSGAFLLNLIFIMLYYNRLKICSFDPRMARAVGISERAWHYLLMTIVSLTVVAAFESVGAILVVAMLILPGATAFLLTRKLSSMLFISAGVAIACALGGFYSASVFDASLAGFMAVFGGLLFGLVVIGHAIKSKLQRVKVADQ